MEGPRSFSETLCNNLRVRVYFSTFLRELCVFCLNHFRGIMPGPFHGCYRKKGLNRIGDSCKSSHTHFLVDKKPMERVYFLFYESHRTKVGFERRHIGTKHRCPRTDRFVMDLRVSLVLSLAWDVFSTLSRRYSIRSYSGSSPGNFKWAR